MRTIVKPLCIFGFLSGFFLQGLNAEEKRELTAHQHGHGSLNIAIEGKNIAMELIAPGSDIVGFEHEARTAEDKKRVETATQSLKAPSKLFVFSKQAGCILTSIDIEGFGEDDDKEKHGTEHDKHDHAEKEAHNEYHVSYELSCQAPSELTSIEFTYFDVFKRAEELDVSIVGEKGQSKFEVSREKPTIGLNGVM